MTFDASIKVTDIVIVVATLVGPILAVYASDYRRKKDEVRERKVRIFRTMMANRSLPAAPAHVEAINLIEQEFNTSNKADRDVIEAWKLYRRHLDPPHNNATFEEQRQNLHNDLLGAMSKALDYGFAKSDIKMGTYTPNALGNIEIEQAKLRLLFIDTLEGKKPLRVIVENDSTNDK